MPSCQQLFAEPLLGGRELRQETRQCNPIMIAAERTAFNKPVKKRIGHLRVVPRLAIHGQLDHAESKGEAANERGVDSES